jgi:hypothetical protein
MSADTNTNMNTPAQFSERHQPQRGRTRAPVQRSANDVVQSPPTGWLVKIHELVPDPSNQRLRMRIMIFEHPDKGYRLLPFLTRRVPRRMRTDNGEVEAMDDFDILPANPLEAALPASTVAQFEVLENLTIIMAEYGKKQAEMPPPSKKPVTHRPFTPTAMSAVARTIEKKKAAPPQEQRQQNRQPQRGRSDRNSNRPQQSRDDVNRRQRELDITLLYLL